MNVGLYVRVSTQEQAKEGYSIDEQIDRLTKYADAHGWNIVKCYTDAGFSGGSTNRPALQELITAVKNGFIDKVLVYKLDRLSRSQKDTLNLIEDVFLANNADFVSMSENFDTATPFGRAMIGILAVFAQLEREQIKERMQMGKEARAKSGLWHGGNNPPTGYDYIDGQLVVNEYEAMQIRELHDLFQQGYSIRAISKMFADKGYTHKYGKWTLPALSRVLSNPVYIGKIHEYDGLHQPIIDEQTFRTTQECRQTANIAPRGKTLLGGLLFCKQCGGRYGILRKKPSYKYYSCYSRSKMQPQMIKDANCHNKNWRETELDNLILNEIKKLTLITDPTPKKETTKKADIIKKEISKIDTQISRLIDLYSLGKIPFEQIKTKTDELTDRKEKLTAELNTTAPLTQERAKELITTFAELIETGTDDQIRRLVRTLINKIELDNEDITIYWNFV